MRIHHLRNATCVLEVGDAGLLVDPMLGERGSLPAFARFRHHPRRNPTVALPDHARRILDRVTHCLITHSRTFGIRALQHTDHLDPSGESFLKRKNIPVICRKQDAAYLKKWGMRVETKLMYWRPAKLQWGKITAVPARHGHGWIHFFMANGSGYYLEFPGEPSLYICGDTVFTKHVKRTLLDLNPDIAVVPAGGASLDMGGPILMPLEELMAFVRNAPGQVIANHLEALNHCPTTRMDLKKKLEDQGLLPKVLIPDDGETLTLTK